MVCILENVGTTDLHVALTRDGSKSRLRSKVDQLSTEITLVLRHTLIQTTGKTRIYNIEHSLLVHNQKKKAQTHDN